MKRSGLTEFEIEETDLKLRICRKTDDAPTIITQTQAPFPVAAPAPAVPTFAPAEVPIDPAKIIKSPMVGTFYEAPSPENPPFIAAGDKVTADSTVCIIEAMKVMNEIKAEVSGTIDEILVKNGDSVEYGQPLFRLK